MKTIDLSKKQFVANQEISTTVPSCTDEFDVRVIKFPPPEDLSQCQMLAAVEQSGTVDFWLRPEEDGYTESDGTAI